MLMLWKQTYVNFKEFYSSKIISPCFQDSCRRTRVSNSQINVRLKISIDGNIRTWIIRACMRPITFGIQYFACFRTNLWIMFLHHIFKLNVLLQFRINDDRILLDMAVSLALHWRHNDHDGVSNHQPHDCLLNRLFRRRSKITSKLRVTGLCEGNSPGPVNSTHKGPVTRKCFHLMTSSWANRLMCSAHLNSC